MNELTLVAVAGGAVVIVLLVVQLVRAARQERLVQQRLADMALALSQAQSDSLVRIGGQVSGVIEGFHRSLAEFGQHVQGGQTTTGEALRVGLEDARRTLGAQLEGLVSAVNAQLAASQQNLGEHLQGATRVFGEVKGQLGQVAEMAARMQALAREIEELQGILKAPKLRGNLGEASLEEFLRQVLPPTFWETQYRFAGGQVVDAVIKLRGNLVPVDAKFPLESFQRMAAAKDDGERKSARREFERSVRARIDEIAEKYIRPGEGTYEFALMFIPAENVYYEVIIRDEGLGNSDSLLAYATSKRIVPVSPNSFYAYLATIATGLKGMQVEARAREIQGELGRLQRDFARFGEVFRLLGRHLGDAHKKFDEADKLAVRLSDRLEVAAGGREDALPSGERSELPGDGE